MTRIVCVSDTHCRLDQIHVPDGDILIHAGDLTSVGSKEEYVREVRKLAALPHLHKAFVPGNHDRFCEKSPEWALGFAEDQGVTYLGGEGETIAGLRFWGSPMTPRFFNWAFMYDRARGREVWADVPAETDVLVTHGPPHQVLNLVLRRMEHVGCSDLALAVARVRPKLHVFGHIHCGHGERIQGGTHHVNAAICDEGYSPSQPPIVVDL